MAGYITLASVDRRFCVCQVSDYMTNNYLWRCVKGLIPDNPFCLYPTFPRMNSWGWVGGGTCGWPQAKHMALGRSIVWACLGTTKRNCIVARVTQTRRRGVCQGQRESHRSLWPFNLLVASPTDHGIGHTCPHSVIGNSINVAGIDKGLSLTQTDAIMVVNARAEVSCKILYSTRMNYIISTIRAQTN